MTAPRFLIDENLSPRFVGPAHARGYVAAHVNHLGVRTEKDWDLLKVVESGDWVLVTNNAIEFRGRYRRIEVHCRVVFLQSTRTVIITRHMGHAMPLNIRSEAVRLLADKLAARLRVSKADAVKLALENELRRLDEAFPPRERLRPLQDRVLARPATGQEADKVFYDDLSNDR